MASTMAMNTFMLFLNVRGYFLKDGPAKINGGFEVDPTLLILSKGIHTAAHMAVL